jgi:hypothetical protein
VSAALRRAWTLSDEDLTKMRAAGPDARRPRMG